MRPGPDTVLACPYCDSLGRVKTLLSGNFCGARLRSDGLLSARMMFRQPRVLACNACDGLFSLSRATRVGEVRILDKDAGRLEWRAAERFLVPDAERCFAGLAQNVSSDQADEKWLRILAMWDTNGTLVRPSQREPKPLLIMAAFLAPVGKVLVDPPPPVVDSSLQAAHHDNLEALALLLDVGDEEEGLMLADVYRQLGRFDEGAAAAAAIDSPDLSWAASQIRALCERADTEPRWLDSPGEE